MDVVKIESVTVDHRTAVKSEDKRLVLEACEKLDIAGEKVTYAKIIAIIG